MAFPVVESSAAYDAGSSAATSHAVPLPATVSPNALLVIVGRAAVAGAIAVTGGGWTIVQDSSDGSDDVSFWMYRDTLAAGTEDGSTVTITHGSGKLAAISYSITGAANPATRAPEASTVAVGTGSNPGPTTCTPTGGAKDYLWIAVGLAGGEHTSPPSTIPANYGSSVGANTGTAGAAGTNARVYSATRNLNAASEDPGTWTTSVAVDLGWTAWTLAIHPVGIQAHTVTPTDTASIADAVTKTRGKAIADSAAIADAQTPAWTADRRTDNPVSIADSFSRVHVAARSVADSVALADTLGLARALVIADTVAIADNAATDVFTAHEVNPSDAVTIADALSLARGKAVADSVSLADATTKARDKALAETVAIADQTTKASTIARSLADSVSIADALGRVLAIARAVADTASLGDVVTRVVAYVRSVGDSVSLADAADPVNVPPGAVDHTVQINDSLSLADSASSARTIVRSVADTVTVGDGVARMYAASRVFEDGISLSDSVVTFKSAATPGILDVGDVRHVRLLGRARHARLEADTRLVKANARARLR